MLAAGENTEEHRQCVFGKLADQARETQRGQRIIRNMEGEIESGLATGTDVFRMEARRSGSPKYEPLG